MHVPVINAAIAQDRMGTFGPSPIPIPPTFLPSRLVTVAKFPPQMTKRQVTGPSPTLPMISPPPSPPGLKGKPKIPIPVCTSTSCGAPGLGRPSPTLPKISPPPTPMGVKGAPRVPIPVCSGTSCGAPALVPPSPTLPKLSPGKLSPPLIPTGITKGIPKVPVPNQIGSIPLASILGGTLGVKLPRK
jgi:hypothetical protein